MSQLDRHLQELARTPVLLVATDYDGTLAPIVADPDDAAAHREALVALRGLAELPNTQVAIVSGRALSDLARLSGAPEHVHLVGSHGSEFDPGFAASLPPDVRELHRTVAEDLHGIAELGRGLTVETKPASVAFHYRNAEEQVAASAIRAVLEGPASKPGVQTRTGKKVVELSVVPTDKGRALLALRQRFGATAALYLGDDRTDEDAFAILSGPDMAVKVGPGETRAPYRIDGPEEVARLLAKLAEERQAFLHGSEAVPIEEHSMLSDLRTVALVTPDARISWLCLPRIDSSALFAELLGGETAGTWWVGDAAGRPPTGQQYRSGSLVLETTFEEFKVTDYLDCSLGRPAQRAGRSDLIRILEGRGRARVEFSPRMDFGRVPTRIRPRGEGLEIDWVDGLVLRSPGVEWSLERVGRHETARAEIDLSAGPVQLELRFGTGDLTPSVTPDLDRLRRTRRFWSDWASKLRLPRRETELVRTSALLLRGLCHGPSGAIAAAATTSLPECLGGIRNWDYRFCWLRDAALSAEALVRLGSLREAMRFLDWVLGVLDHIPDPDRLRPLYGVTGGELGPEAEIAELSGYGGSRPVRIGNAAALQVQLDVFGPIVKLVHELCNAGAPLSFEHWRMVEKMAHAVSARWQEPDHGIWEVRMHPRHHVHSKAMCWMTLELAARIAERFRGQTRPEWTDLADEIRSEVLLRGYNPELGYFTSAFESEHLDAAALWVGLSGLVPPRDPRFVATVDAVARELLEGPTVYRYRIDDGLPGREGGFHVCTSWLIDAMILVGRLDEARELFERLCALAGPTGCLSEQYDPRTGRALGNHPQAYSHLGIVHNALNLERALARGLPSADDVERAEGAR